MGIETHDSGLVRLGNVRKDYINHSNQHSVAKGMTGILDDGNNIGAVGSHSDQVTTGAVRELNSVDGPRRSYEISDMTDGCPTGGTEIQHFRSRAHVDVVETTEDTSSQLATEGIPYTVLSLGGSGDLTIGGRCS